MKVLVCGSRDWSYWNPIKRELSKLSRDTTIIQGEARGADSMAKAVAEGQGKLVESYPADWSQYGRAAGPIRNKQMLDEGKPDLVLAFSHDMVNSKGTANMVMQARKRGIEVKVFER